jgi:hypothetical protein
MFCVPYAIGWETPVAEASRKAHSDPQPGAEVGYFSLPAQSRFVISVQCPRLALAAAALAARLRSRTDP